MREVEAVRVRVGMSKTELATELGTTKDALRAWMTGRTVGRKETVAKIKDFLKRNSV
jgi:DNA-binding transcriptional regulator YiaG